MPTRNRNDGGPKCALVVAHPGHELRVHGWVERCRPVVFVLTDGSGHNAESRLGSTTRVLGDAGARQGPIYGRFSDRAFYEAVLGQDLNTFGRLTVELADAFVAQGITLVAGDGAEGYNPTHDICRVLVDAAVAAAAARTPAGIASYEFPLVAPPNAFVAEASASEQLRIELSDESLERKIRAAQSYEELRGEVEHALKTWGPDAFRTEWLTTARTGHRMRAEGSRPYYEQHGENRVRDHVYEKVIRYTEHVAPLAAALAVRAAAPSR